jgi:hypothetical protein
MTARIRRTPTATPIALSRHFGGERSGGVP